MQITKNSRYGLLVFKRRPISLNLRKIKVNDLTTVKTLYKPKNTHGFVDCGHYVAAKFKFWLQKNI